MFSRIALLIPVIALLAMPLPLAGCAGGAVQLSPPIGANHTPAAPQLDLASASKDLAVAQRMIRNGDYSQGIPRLMHVVTAYSTTAAAVDARYFLGLTYYQIGGYAQATRFFQEYLDRAPEGDYAALSREYLAALANGDELLRYEIEKLESQLAARAASGDENPEQLAEKLDLADLYWRDGQYQKSGELYIALLKEWPQLETDTTIRRRIEREPGGNYVILTPEEVGRRYAESDPLLIYNTQSFRSGRTQGWANNALRDLYFHVSGEVTNRGSVNLNNVEIIVTIYASGSRVYDTKTVRIGRLRPGENRAFSVRFSNFDWIENVRRFECVGVYDR